LKWRPAMIELEGWDQEKLIDLLSDFDEINLDGIEFEGNDLDSFLSQDKQGKLTTRAYRFRARKFLKNRCEACSAVKRLQIHHKDGEIMHNTQDNVQTLCIYCHKFLHDMAQRLKLVNPGSLASPILIKCRKVESKDGDL